MDMDKIMELETLAAWISTVREQVAALSNELDALAKKVDAKTRQVDSPRQHAERLLRAQIMTPHELAAELGQPLTAVQAMIRELKDRVYNVGTHRYPRLTWVVGDNASIEELCTAVELLVRERPVTREELRAATGARDNRIGGALRRIQRNGVRVENLGTEIRARWFAMPTQTNGTSADRRRAITSEGYTSSAEQEHDGPGTEPG